MSSNFGDFAGGLVNGLSLGMKYKSMQQPVTEIPQAQQAVQQAPAPQQEPGGIGLPTNYTAYSQQQAPAQQQAAKPAETQGNGVWSLISSIFGGAMNNG